MLRLMALVGLSLIIHLLMYEGVLVLPSTARPLDSNTEIEVIEETSNHTSTKFDRPVVKNTDAPEPKDMKDPAHFMAEKNQRFEKQTKAANIGAFQNQQIKASQQSANKKPATDGDTPEFAREVQAQLAQVQAASVPYELPSEIENGSATNLNADAHIYASFYNRILDLFYSRWSERLNAIFQRMPTDVYKSLAGKIWITDVEIWLSAEGLYQKGLVMSSSGFKPFDDAGIYAFQSAKFFPNPPRAKVEADGGRIRLRYRIGVHVR